MYTFFSSLYYFTFMDILHPKNNPCMFDESVIAFVNHINIIMKVKVLNLYSKICIIVEVVPIDTQDTQLHILVKQ